MYEIYEGFPIPPKQNLTCVNYEAFNRRKEEKKKESFFGASERKRQAAHAPG